MSPAVQQAPTLQDSILKLMPRSWCTAGNFEYDANPRDVERLFDRFGPIERLDMKTGEHALLVWRLQACAQPAYVLPALLTRVVFKDHWPCPCSCSLLV